MLNTKIQDHLKTHPTVYVSITGLQVRSIWKVLWFFKHAIASRNQAAQSPGLLHLDVRKINGIHHTLSVWENKAAMLGFLRSGAHLLAIRSFRKIATGKTFGYEASTIPDWKEVHSLWQKQGVEY